MMEVRASYLDQLPQLRRRIGRKQRLRAAAARFAAVLENVAPAWIKSRCVSPRLLERLARILDSRQRVHVAPTDVFGVDACAFSGPLSKVILTEAHNSGHIAVERISAAQLVEQLAIVTKSELNIVSEYYEKFRFAFPQATNPLLNQLPVLLRERLQSTMVGKDTFVLRHPRPVSISALQSALDTILEPVDAPRTRRLEPVAAGLTTWA
jgi:hypothetical protein